MPSCQITTCWRLVFEYCRLLCGILSRKFRPNIFKTESVRLIVLVDTGLTKIVFVGPQNEHLTLDPDDAGVGIKHSITEVKAKSIWGAVTVLMCMRVRHCVDEWVGGWVGVHRSARLCVFPRACVLVCLPCHVCGA